MRYACSRRDSRPCRRETVSLHSPPITVSPFSLPHLSLSLVVQCRAAQTPFFRPVRTLVFAFLPESHEREHENCPHPAIRGSHEMKPTLKSQIQGSRPGPLSPPVLLRGTSSTDPRRWPIHIKPQGNFKAPAHNRLGHPGELNAQLTQDIIRFCTLLGEFPGTTWIAGQLFRTQSRISEYSNSNPQTR